MKEPVITFESLMDVKYGELESKFEEMGVKGAWKAGTKKKELVEEALAQYRELMELIESGMSEEEAQKKLLIKSEARKIAEKQAKDQERKEKEKQQASKDVDLITRIKRMKLTEEQLKSNLANIESNLANNPHNEVRLTLVRKRDAIQSILNEESSSD